MSKIKINFENVEELTAPADAIDRKRGADRLKNLRESRIAALKAGEITQNWSFGYAIDHLRSRGHAHGALDGWFVAAHHRTGTILLAWTVATAIDHLRSRGYVYGVLAGWHAGSTEGELELSPEDAQAFVYLNLVAEVALPGGITFSVLMDRAAALNMRNYKITMPSYRKLRDLFVTDTKGELLDEHSMQSPDARIPTSEPLKFVDDGKPKFQSGDIDILTHALRLWANAGKDIGIPVRQEYVDQLLATARAHTDFEK